MNKKEIYEHLANIYLDASTKSTKKKNKLRFIKPAKGLLVSALLMTVGIAGFISHSSKKNLPQGQIALFLYQDPAKINFNFDPAKKESFTLNLKLLNLNEYKSLAFTARKTNPKDILSLRIEFTDRFGVKSEVYIKDISSKWTEHRIDFSRFSRINNWSQMKALSFSVEEWNAREKSGIVYLDNIKVLK